MRLKEIAIAAGILSGLGGLEAQIKVACVGDSITQGSGLSNPSTESYPAKLQRLLGSGYQVGNYGVSGRTLLKRGDYPYWNESAYVQSRNWGPDVVIIKLGTNDSKPQNWRFGTNFVADFEALIASYTNLASRPLMVVCTPCPVYGSGAFDIRPVVVADEIAPRIRELAGRLGVRLLDVHVGMSGHPEWFPDTVHPNSRGTSVLAALVRNSVNGGDPPGPGPALGVTALAARRIELRWPSEWAGLVLQSAVALPEQGGVWTVVEQLAVNDQVHVRVTNSSAGIARFYRLYRY